MAIEDVYKRKLFGNLTPDQYQGLVDYARDFQSGGIDALNVNRGVTAEDVLRATSPLSDPVAPGATSSVAKFNEFLAGILGAKMQRVAGEEEKLSEANAAAVSAVTQALQPTEPNIKEVDGALVDVSDPKNPTVIYQSPVADEPEILKLTGGVEISADRFDALSQADKNKLLGLQTGEDYKFKEIDGEGNIVVGIQDASGNIKLKTFEGDFGEEDKISDKMINQARYLELLDLKDQDPDNWTKSLQNELTLLEEIVKPKDLFEKSSDEYYAGFQRDLRDNKLQTKAQYDAIIAASNVIEQESFKSGPLTSGLTILQRIGDDLGLDLKGGLELLGIEILNKASDSELLETLTRQFGIQTSSDLAGAISNLELLTLFKTTVRLSAPEEFNKNFIQGMEYLARAKVKETEYALATDNRKEFDKMMDDWFASPEGQPPGIFNQAFKPDANTIEELEKNYDINIREILNQNEKEG